MNNVLIYQSFSSDFSFGSILWTKEWEKGRKTVYSLCLSFCPPLCSAPLFSLSALCRSHGACILISNGVKHKQTVVLHEWGSTLFPSVREGRHEAEPQAGVNTGQTWGVVTGVGRVWGVGVTPGRAEQMWIQKDTCADETQRAFMDDELYWMHKELTQINWCTQASSVLFACNDHAYLQGAEVLWRSFCLFPVSYWNMLLVGVCHQDWDATDSSGYPWISLNLCHHHTLFSLWVFFLKTAQTQIFRLSIFENIRLFSLCPEDLAVLALLIPLLCLTE